jgi:hypothetical protein
MSKNMTILDRRLRALLIGTARGPDRSSDRPRVGRLDRAVRAGRGDARDQRRRLLPALLRIRDGWQARAAAGALTGSRKE